MSVSKPSESSPVKGNGGSNMRLTLSSAGDHNGNAFPVSTSSSSSSSSYMGESSPESMQSLSSLSGGRIDSPLDYDMLEVTLMTTVVTEIKVTDVISKWTIDEDRKQNQDDASVEKRTTEISESNDNSVSVYLDATGDYHPDTWNDNDMTQALSLKTNGSGHNKDDEISYGDVSRRSSTIPDSDATEIPLDECDDNNDDDEEETLFLSLSSDMGVQKNFTSQIKDCFIDPGGSADKVEGVTCPLDLPLDSKTEPDASEESFKPSQKSLSCCSSPKPEQGFPPDESEKCAVGSRSPSRPVKLTKNKIINDTSTAKKPGIKLSTVKAERVSVVDLKNVRAKVGSRNAKANIGSPSKSPSQRSSATTVKKAFPRKEDKQSREGEKQQRSSSGPVKVAMVLKPIRGKSHNLKTHHKTTTNHSPQPVVSRTLSTSTSSLGSEMVEDATRKPGQEVLDKHGTTKSIETTRPSGDVGKQCVENKNEAMMAAAHVEKPKSQSRKVSSKLGPNARQHGKGIRLDKVCGSATPPGHGSPGPRQVQRDVSVLGEGAWSGSPTRARQSQSQSQQGQGIPKPRTTTERVSTLTDLATTTPISKPTASQHSAPGLTGRQAIPTASKLPVKGLPPSLSSSSLGSNENAGATIKTPAGVSTPMGTKSDQWPSRSTVPEVSQSPTKPPISSTAATMNSSDKGTSANIGVTAASKPPAMRSRALSLQARTTTTGLKGAAAAGHNTAKMTVASQGVVKQTSQYPLQRSGSVRLTRLNSTVDKNKPREAQTRPTNTNSSSHIAASAGGANHNQQQPPPDLVADVVNSNAPVTQVLPVPVTESTNTGSGTTAAPGHGFKARTGLRSSPKTGSRIRSASKPVVAGLASGTLEAKHNKEQTEKKNQAINQLKKLLVQGNRRVEALAMVIQHLFTEREEALKQKKELSLELERLRAELVTSSQCYERLQEEKEEVRISFEEALKRQEEQHKEELVQLEDRLRSFYQTEWDKVHQTYQEEADKCRMLMEQQVEELRNQQIAERKNQELSHSQTVETLKQQYEASIQELKSIQQTDLDGLEKILKETESALSEKIRELSAEKETLNEKLQAEEERRKRILTDKNLKDSHTLYLEQELESLKVVLEIKNNQLHQKEKKLMEMDKLMETNVKLEECLNKVQQENEDYKARMDKHAALSKQLSTEQAILQQTLQKESKVNKRLSMENEELLWKLNNGDLLASPRHLSPTSPFSSPRNSASFSTSAPLSPR